MDIEERQDQLLLMAQICTSALANQANALKKIYIQKNKTNELLDCLIEHHTNTSTFRYLNEQQERECCICLINVPDVCLVHEGDFGHVTCCYPCSLTIDKCPICRNDILNRIKLYYS
jgi:hypothetical protein